MSFKYTTLGNLPNLSVLVMRMKHLPSSWRLGDRVRYRNGRHGAVEGIFAGSVALVFWDDQGPPSYEALKDLSKVMPEKPERESPPAGSRQFTGAA
jgi:hypothetical protein